MELNLQRQAITINEVVFDGSVEQPIECDALLPDYCPDIMAILKCNVTTHIGSSLVSGERLTVEGIATSHIYYTCEAGNIRHVEYKIPFAKVVELRGNPLDPIVTVTPSLDYVNCRAVNQRRVDVRGAITLAIKVVARKEENLISDAQGEGMQLKRDMVEATEIINQTQTTISLNEELEIGHGKSQIGNIVRKDCRVNAQDHKIIAGKIVIKGEFMLHILYQPLGDEQSLEVMEYSMPISQILDSDGADENCICDVALIVSSCEIQAKSGEDGEYRTFLLDANITAFAVTHRHVSIPVASDAYSTKYECNCKHRQVQFSKMVAMIDEVVMHKTTLDLPEDVESVMDVWCEVDSLNWRQEGEVINTSMRLTVSMFAKTLDGQSHYFEQSSDIEHPIAVPAGCMEVAFEPSADVLSSTFNLVGKEKIDIRCEVLIKGSAYCTIKKNAIGEIIVNEQNEKNKEKNKLFLYFAEDGESIWDIAKHYNTSANAIWQENSIEQDILPTRQMLFIPIV